MDKSSTILVMIFTVFICITKSENIYTAEKQNPSASSFELLFNPEYKNSIIICGIKMNQSIDNDHSEHNLLIFARNGIQTHQKEIQEKKLKIAIFSKSEPQEHNFCYARLRRPNSKQNSKTEYCSLYGNKDPNEKKHIIYVMCAYDKQRYSFNDIHGDNFFRVCTLADITKTACLILIDDTVLQQCDLQEEIYRQFKKEKKIIIHNPYSGTIERYYPRDKILPTYWALTSLCAIGILGFAYYYNPEIGKYCLDALQYGSMLT